MKSFFAAAKTKPLRKQRRKAANPAFVHNFMDVAEAVNAIAKIIDPEAFADRDITACAIAMQKARAAVAAYEKILGTQRRVMIITHSHGKTTYRMVTKGSRPLK